jgi:hypothetical protein
MNDKQKDGGDLLPGLGEIPKLESKPKTPIVTIASVGGKIEIRFPRCGKQQQQVKKKLPSCVHLFGNYTAVQLNGILNEKSLKVDGESKEWYEVFEANPLFALLKGTRLYIEGEKDPFSLVSVTSPRSLLVVQERTDETDDSGKGGKIVRHIAWDKVLNLGLRFT